MDDLDHSIHIANYDWTSFYEECEECGLVQPSLACPDSWSLSDSEELGNPSSVFSAGHQEPEQSCAASSDGAEGSAAGCCMEEENCTDGVKSVSVQMVQCGSAGGQEETKAEAGLGNPEENAFNTAEHIEEEKHANIKTTLQTEQLNVQCSEGESSELKRGDEAVQIETDMHDLISTQQTDPISSNLTELDVNEPITTDRSLLTVKVMNAPMFSHLLGKVQTECQMTSPYVITKHTARFLHLYLYSKNRNPETYAEATGHTRPVYAISAFWDEMEKLTINDILQLRMGRSTPPRDTVTPNTDDHGPLLDTVEYNMSDGVLMDTSDTADSDYFTQPDESKRDRSSCEFSTSDFEEEYWQYLSASRNHSPDPQSKRQQSPGDSPFTAHEEEESLSSETPVPLEDYAEDQEASDLILSRLGLPRPITKSKSLQNVSAFKTEDLSLQLLLCNDESSLFLSSCPSLEENVVLTASDSLGTQIPTSLLGEHDQISLPEVFEYLYSDDGTNGGSQCVKVYDPVDISTVYDYSLCAFSDDMSFSFLYNFQRSEEKPIPIFSCSQPLIRELTFPNPDLVFLSSDFEEEGDISPFRIMSGSFFKGDDCGVSASHGFYNWKSLMRKVRFPDKGSIWCSRSGATVFPDEVEKITTKSVDPPLTVLTARRGSSSPFLLFSELALQKRVLDAGQATRQEGIFSSLKQSDMCMVCIAFASWVLKSSDPESADAWKAALLANVSALSAIQYLRQYVKRRNPS
ncbi:hypothetical protein CesoFtcFv8_002398 [Champsocephalus esox]|uniref:PGC-1 and ERR-induced regulator in muscle protein 1 n=1 Tax=Champsocephalus esox TaxID=159716 RepID=A0AAN8CXU7_9TELE|nr:hypothetical protein CesoFtcFv8_002398 [Champsocephalus esox]